MCTLTFIRSRRGVRLVHSRDEQRTRTEGVPPASWSAGSYALISPRDPDAGGTWIAARDDGVILAVMNRNPEPPPTLDPTALRSRGLLIEQLAPLPPQHLPNALRDIRAHRYAPFRAFALVPTGTPGEPDPVLWAAEWDRADPAPDARPRVTRHGFPCCWVSSGLGDSIVADRLPLFETLVSPDPTPEAQDAYHRHAWSSRGAASVLMSRPDARTVSITVAETTPDDPEHAVRMSYTPLVPGPSIDAPMTPADPHFATLRPRNLPSPG